MLTHLELLDRLAALIPPPRRHRHRTFGTLAPNAPLRGAVTALAGPAKTPAARYAWALLLTRIYKLFPLRCPKCGDEMRIIAFINEAIAVREITLSRRRPGEYPRRAPCRQATRTAGRFRGRWYRRPGCGRSFR